MRRSSYNTSTFLNQKELSELIATDVERDTGELHRMLSLLDLIVMNLGSIVGAGIFSLSSFAAHWYAGPSILISHIIAFIVSMLTALTYADLTSKFKGSPGSTYSYCQVSLGQGPAFIIGWNLIASYAMLVSSVAGSWSGYMHFFVARVLGWSVNSRLTSSFLSFDADKQIFSLNDEGGVNLSALVITAAIAILLWRFNLRVIRLIVLGMVALKVLLLVVYDISIIQYYASENFSPFIPTNGGSFSKYGVSGMLKAAVLVFFAYSGFESVSTATREAKETITNIPVFGKVHTVSFAIVFSLALSGILYIITAFFMLGAVNYKFLFGDESLAIIADFWGVKWLTIFAEICICFGLPVRIYILIYTRA